MYVDTHIAIKVRKPASWMVAGTDDRVLETFAQEGNLTPKGLSREGMVERVAALDRKRAGERCRELAAYGLLEYVDEGIFALTDTGEAYLLGELDAAELEPVDDADAQ